MATASQHEHDAANHGTLKSYIIGFILSIGLTILPYFAVTSNLVSGLWLWIVLICTAIAQLVVQLVFFLHLNNSPSQRWHLISFIFTFLIVAILVAGSLWIMWNLNYNMMDR